MIRGIFTLGAIVYTGLKLIEELEKESQENQDSTSQEETRERPESRHQKLTKIKVALEEKAKSLQEELGALHEVYMVAGRLTKSSTLGDLGLQVKGKSLEDQIKDKEAELNKVMLELNNVRKLIG